MTYKIGLRPTGTTRYGGHDPSVAIFKDNELVYAAEEERFTRNKHGSGEFPINSLQAGLNELNIDLSEVKKIVITQDLRKVPYILPQFKYIIKQRNGLTSKLGAVKWGVEHTAKQIYRSNISTDEELVSDIRDRLNEIDKSVPPIKIKPHHKCHAASTFHFSPFDESLILTIDGRGEADSTVVWSGTSSGIERLESFEFPNSLGRFFAAATIFLGFRAKNGEGKVMGLAPYGDDNHSIESTILDIVEKGPNYDVTKLTAGGYENSVKILEELFDRGRSQDTNEFTDWEKDFAYVAQKFIEDTVCSIVSKHIDSVDTNNVCLAGGVALNCKMNKRIMEMECVDEVFIQPAANDAGVALGACVIDSNPNEIDEMTNVYHGTRYSCSDIKDMLEENKIGYREPSNLESEVASQISNGQIVGWFQGNMELGPRALGNRSILADPRSADSRDRVNKYVKHREGWRPFAPSILEERADQYLENYQESSFMIKTYDVSEDKIETIPAVLHPGDNTTRPQAVSRSENHRYWKLISEFEKITGVPVLLNTSFNDHGEPIVESPKHALSAFYNMGLDTLVIEDILVEK
jgi:carbamoyltransferase